MSRHREVGGREKSDECLSFTGGHVYCISLEHANCGQDLHLEGLEAELSMRQLAEAR